MFYETLFAANCKWVHDLTYDSAQNCVFAHAWWMHALEQSSSDDEPTWHDPSARWSWADIQNGLGIRAGASGGMLQIHTINHRIATQFYMPLFSGKATPFSSQQTVVGNVSNVYLVYRGFAFFLENLSKPEFTWNGRCWKWTTPQAEQSSVPDGCLTIRKTSSIVQLERSDCSSRNNQIHFNSKIFQQL